jgi:hypothetical protein
MARGWESKSVEDQQAEASSTPDKSKRQLTPEQKNREYLRNGLLLSRKRVLQQLTSAVNPQHRQMLETALADLDGKLQGLGQAG